jgi:hypothetical protein
MEFKHGTNVNLSLRNQPILAKCLVVVNPHVHSRRMCTGSEGKGLVPVIIQYPRR